MNDTTTFTRHNVTRMWMFNDARQLRRTLRHDRSYGGHVVCVYDTYGYRRAIVRRNDGTYVRYWMYHTYDDGIRWVCSTSSTDARHTRVPIVGKHGYTDVLWFDDDDMTVDAPNVTNGNTTFDTIT